MANIQVFMYRGIASFCVRVFMDLIWDMVGVPCGGDRLFSVLQRWGRKQVC